MHRRTWKERIDDWERQLEAASYSVLEDAKIHARYGYCYLIRLLSGRYVTINQNKILPLGSVEIAERIDGVWKIK